VLDAAGPALQLGCQAQPYLIKPNVGEAQVLAGRPMTTPSDIALGAADLQQLGAKNVIISMGKAGALLRAEGETWVARSPIITGKNPIGAGDSMVGGLVWARTQGKSLRDSLGWGVASGAATASLSGTEVGARPLIEALLAQVRFERLETW
jgi:fructose-1-phosphate kinase PfkB-like protein